MVAELSIHKIKRIKEKEERKRIKKKNKVLSAERLGTKLRVTENRCVLFNSLSHAYIYASTQNALESLLLPQP